MALIGFASILTVASASSSLFARNNPPQPPCIYPYTKFVYSGCYIDSVASRALPFMTELDFNNATVEQCTAYCKGNNYRYAGLEYHGQCFCGSSVSAAAASEAECSLPCNGDPTQACGGEDRISIYQDPTFPDADDIAISGDFLSLGCYTEGDSGRSLDYSQWDYLNISAMTTEMCLTACGAKGFPFAGTEFGRECYCGVVLGNGTTTADANDCSTPCTGNNTQTCGGADRLSLYVAKNLESTEPCGPPIISSSSVASSTATLSSSQSTSLSVSTSSSFTSHFSLTSTPSLSTKPSTQLPPTSTSSKVSSASSSIRTTSKVCIGYLCPKTTTTTKASTSPTKKSTSTSCKTTAKPTQTPKSTSKIISSTKKHSTLKTTTPCKTSSKSTAKSTVKSTSTRKYGGW